MASRGASGDATWMACELMSAPEHPAQLAVIGVHLTSDAYPNVRHTLTGLRAIPALAIDEYAFPMRAQGHLSARPGLRALVSAAVAHAKALRALWRQTAGTRVFVPYPALFLLFLWSLCPGRRRKRIRIVADAFISVHDTLVKDRGLLSPSSLRARLLHALESRALGAADAVVVDTLENAAFMAHSLELPSARVHAVGLCIDETAYAPRDISPRGDGRCRVLFTGTLIPLHGIEVIMGAMIHLATREDIEFILIGDGQQAPLLEAFMATPRPRVRWSRRWHSALELADEVAAADICLGVFSAGPKAQRVGPLKVHAYACMGKAIVTGDTRWARRMADALAEPPFVTVPTGDATALAHAIAALADDSALRARLARASRAAYTQQLGNARSLARLQTVLFDQ